MKKLTIVFVSFCALIAFCASCSKTQPEFDAAWQAHNNKLFVQAQLSGKYHQMEYNNGAILWKPAPDFPADDDQSTQTPQGGLGIRPSGTPDITDSVRVRYEGWYFDMNNKKVIFDTTEGDNNGKETGFKINGGLISGWIGILQTMKTGDAVEICLPSILGYYDQSSSGTNGIPPYTTLWFDIKLTKIIPINPDEYKNKEK